MNNIKEGDWVKIIDILYKEGDDIIENKDLINLIGRIGTVDSVQKDFKQDRPIKVELGEFGRLGRYFYCDFCEVEKLSLHNGE